MPLPLAPLVPIALRIGLAAGSVWAIRQAIRRNTHPGRTDQRAEDALDDLAPGVAVHHPADRADADARQSNAAARMTRTIRLGRHRYDIDVAVLGRLKIRKS